jgi:hypothetical protein
MLAAGAGPTLSSHNQILQPKIPRTGWAGFAGGDGERRSAGLSNWKIRLFPHAIAPEDAFDQIERLVGAVGEGEIEQGPGMAGATERIRHLADRYEDEAGALEEELGAGGRQVGEQASAGVAAGQRVDAGSGGGQGKEQPAAPQPARPSKSPVLESNPGFMTPR